MLQIVLIAALAASAAFLFAIEYAVGGNVAYRIGYQSATLFLLINAWLMIPVARGTGDGANVARALIAANCALATVFGYWWAFNYFDRAEWFREQFYWVFIVGMAGTLVTLGWKLWVFGKLQGRDSRSLLLYVAAFGVSVWMNWWPQDVSPMSLSIH